MLATAIAWLQEHAGDSFIKGEHTIGPDDRIIVRCEEPALMPREKAVLEVHRRYIDIHVPLKSVESIGWTPLASLKHPYGAFDEAKDAGFYGDSAHSILHVRPGQAAIFFPEDAHAPNIGLGNHRKLCIKIPVE